ncbi:MAG: iron-siderophore ABC transporter substrate-binding protein [Coriobacteriales bacterium]|jgi:iron complex transport system substrate-binding protein|nr:iron-siderophore ABC transporter substrate-binding protein [Coriobacteriales bacterium]
MKQNHSFTKIITLLLCMFLLASSFMGCTSPVSTDTSADNLENQTKDATTETAGTDAAATMASSTSASFPITIKHAFGETVIKAKPERIVTISWSNQDTPLALGVLPVGISEANYGVTDGGSILPWTKEAIAKLGGTEKTVIFNDTDGLDFEAINEVSPDVILAASSGITQEDYDTLSAIAPVVAYPLNPWQTLWRDQVTINAMAMGMETEGKELVAKLDDLIATTVAQYPELKDKNVAFAYFDPADLSTISLYTTGDPRVAFLEDLGLAVAPSVKELEKGAGNFYIQVSSENADKLADIDIILTWASGDGSNLLSLLQADALIGSIPAIKNGAVVAFSESPLAAAQSPSALSIPYTIDEYVATIAEAAKKVK